MFLLVLKRHILLVMAIAYLGAATAEGDQPANDCAWSGPAADWILLRQIPAAEVSGLLGSDVLSFFHGHGIPISFVSRADGDSSVHLKISSATTVREVLEEIVRQAPDYRYEAVDGRVVLYPRSEGYETRIEVKSQRGATRAQALIALLRELKGSTKALQNLRMPVFRGRGGESIYGDTIDYGGARTVISHLVSLIQGRPSATFQLFLAENGHLYFDFGRVPLVQGIDVFAPSAIKLGDSFQAVVSGTLSDGTKVLLEGSGCHVNYGAGEETVVKIDDFGRAVALERGVATIRVQYEAKRAQAHVRVD